jgi:hypothetical protein
MSRFPPLPQVSPDGRFEIRVDEFEDRGSVEYSTHLLERSTGRHIAQIGDSIDGGFRPDGLLLVRAVAWNRHDVLIDADAETFRRRDDLPWLPLQAWSLAESAYLQGWANGIEFRSNDPSLAFPWVEIWIALGAIATAVLMAWKPWIEMFPRITLLVIAALVAVLFVWIVGNALRTRRHMRRLQPPRSWG